MENIERLKTVASTTLVEREIILLNLYTAERYFLENFETIACIDF